MPDRVAGKVVQIAAGSDGMLYALDDKGRVWYGKGVPTPSAMQRFPLPEELEAEKRHAR